MSFSDHKITQFTHRISELADQPNMPADELKARFDACPEELRQAVNGICDEATRLEERVGGIVDQTFADTITKAMLSSELRSELDAKATQSALSSEVSARKSETTARQSADTALSNRISAVESALPGKARIVHGEYTGNNTDNRNFSLGFQPFLVVISCPYLVQFELPNVQLRTRKSDPFHFGDSHLTSTGFTVSVSDYIPGAPTFNPNNTQFTYHYVAFGL